MTRGDTAPSLVVVVTVPVADVDEASGLLWSCPLLGVEERAAGGELVELRAGVEDPADADALAAVLGARWPAVVEAVDGDEWLDAWQAHAVAVEVGVHLAVVPTWLDPAAVEAVVGPDRLRLALPPHRAFGTGAHPTTHLALEALERRVGPATAVLDVGCGSGLLAVAAARLGAARVQAVDVDPEAVRATVATASANGVAAVVEVSDVPVADLPRRADVVVANMELAHLRPVLGAVVARLRPGGCLVLTGLREAQVPELLDRLAAAGVAGSLVEVRDGWALVEGSLSGP